jgi:hypothetical protein
MTDVTTPPEQVEKLRPDPVEKGGLERKVADAPLTSGKVAPEASSSDQAVKRNLQTKPTDTEARLEAKIGAQPPEAEVSDGSSSIVGKVNGTEIENYTPCQNGKQEILGRVEQCWGNRKLDAVAPDQLTNQEREGLGVESAMHYLKDTGQSTDLEPMGGRNKADMLALGKDGKLCVVECKGHTADVKDAGYINSNGEKSGNLASETNDGVYFENEPGWLERNRPHMEKKLQDRIDDPTTSPAEKAKCQRLKNALDQTDFYKQDSYHRITVTAGPQAEYGNITDYARAVKPEKMVQIRLPLKV